MKRKFQTLLMLGFILISHVNHVASTIISSDPLPQNPLSQDEPRELRSHHHRHGHRRHYRHRRRHRNNVQIQNSMNPYANPYMMGNSLKYPRKTLGFLGDALGQVAGGTGGLVSSLGGAVGTLGGGAGELIANAGGTSLEQQPAEVQAAPAEAAPAEAAGGGGLLGAVGGAVDGVGDSVGSALGLGDNAGTGLAVGGMAAGAGYMMMQKRKKEHAFKVRMLEQKIAMKEFQSNLVDQEYQLLLHANRDLHAANGRISNLERNAVYRINARILDYAIGAYY